MRILFVSGNLCDGGAQRVIATISSALAERGHEITLLLYSRNEKEYAVSPKVKISSIRDSYEEYSVMSGMKRLLFIRNFLKDTKPEVAVGFLEGGYGLYMASFGMRFVKVASARVDPNILLQKKGLRAWIDMKWFASADAVVLQTTRQREHAQHTGWKNQVVIANPISEKALSFSEHNYNRPCRRIVMAGRLEKQKNYPMMFAAMKKVVAVYPEVKLDIFGKGSQEETLKQMILEMGLEQYIVLKGWTQSPLEEYANSDIYVLSSDFEGMPNSLMEAMAVGLPCISTNCDTGPEDLIVDGENGYLVPVNDSEMLAKRLLQVIGMDTTQRRALGKKAQAFIRDNMTSDVIASEWETLLNQLLAKH